jgi:bacterioferritin
MKGNPKVIAELNKALREELTAINQYFLHAEMCENWGYHRLADFIKKQSIGEMKHAESLMERILFLDGTPSMQRLEVKIGGTVRAMIENDLALELGAVKMYEAVALCRQRRRQRFKRPAGEAGQRRGRARRLSRSPDASDQRTGLRELSVAADGRDRRVVFAKCCGTCGIAVSPSSVFNL